MDKTFSHQLSAFLERILNLREERREITGFIADVKAEAKAQGFDTKILQKVVERAEWAEKNGADALMEMDAMLQLYEESVGASSGVVDALFDRLADQVLAAKLSVPAADESKAPARSRKLQALRDLAQANARAIGSENR